MGCHRYDLANRSASSVEGIDLPDSMAEYACRLTPIAPAISVCVSRDFFRICSILLLTVISTQCKVC